MSRLLGVLRGRLLCRRMVRAGLRERDGQRWVLTPAGRCYSSMREVE
jgi:hypothetical protein